MKAFRFSAFILILALATAAVFAGGPEIRCQSAAVENVVTDETKVILIVSGRCELFLVDSKLPAAQGEARFVSTDLEHCVITLVRRSQQDLEGQGFKSWKDCCDRAKALSGQKALLDLQGQIAIDSARVVSVRALGYGFAPAEAPGEQPKP
jgi:hypothetical protein